MVFKAAMIGTHGTGKTILTKLVDAELGIEGYEARCIREISREAERLGFPINQETTFEAQMYILHRQIQEEIDYGTHREGIRNAPVLLSDRSVFDNYCYFEKFLERNGFERTEFPLSLVLGHACHFPYDQLYLLPMIDYSVAEDGQRDPDPEFRKEMDSKVRTFLTESEIPYTELPVPKPSDKRREIWKEIITKDILSALRDV